MAGASEAAGGRADERSALERALEGALVYLDGLDERPVARPVDVDGLRAALGGPLPEHGLPAADVVDALLREAEPGLVASAGPRFFGFVVGGALPAAVAADWLGAAWDQNAGLHVSSPTAATVDDVAADWLLELLDLPRDAALALVTGGHMANYTALSAARHAVLARASVDLPRVGLAGAPPITVVVGAEAHASIHAALRMLGLGTDQVVTVAADDQGRMRPEALREALAGVSAPAIVCAQAGNVNSGAFDPFGPIVEAVRAHGGWLHVDGAFGLWARCAPAVAHLAAGVEGADSWATDAHKTLNVPYDCGVAIVRDRSAIEAAMGAQAAYLVGEPGRRDPQGWTPEMSRRARGLTVWAAIRSLGRSGVGELVERLVSLARRFADQLDAAPGVRVLNDVEFTQVLVRFEASTPAAADARGRAVVERVQRDGTCWLGGTVWQGQAAMRISVSNWRTTEADVDRSVEAILAAAAAVPAD